MPYPVNEHGNTYGSLAGMPDDVWGSYEDMHALFPDLVLVEATNGATGYVWKDELDPPSAGEPRRGRRDDEGEEGAGQDRPDRVRAGRQDGRRRIRAGVTPENLRELCK